jgi:hypothetical protein
VPILRKGETEMTDTRIKAAAGSLNTGQPGDGTNSDQGYILDADRPRPQGGGSRTADAGADSTNGSPADQNGGGRPGDSFRSDTGYGFTSDRAQDRANDSGGKGNEPAPPAPARPKRNQRRAG